MFGSNVTIILDLFHSILALAFSITLLSERLKDGKGIEQVGLLVMFQICAWIGSWAGHWLS
jgi:hypothetical protein